MSLVPTIRGPVDVADLGPTLMHEHVFVMAPEALVNYGAVYGPSYWDEDERVADAIAKLRRLRDGGITGLVDPTVPGLGRDITRIQRINAEVDLNIVVASGIYAFLEMPGSAAAVQTGVPVMVHTNAVHQTGLLALRALTEAGVEPGRIVIAHAGDSNDLDYLRALAASGAWLGLDRFGIEHFNPTPDRVRTLSALVAEGYAERIHLSHDAACFYDFMVGNPFFADERPDYLLITHEVIPALRDAGVSQEAIDRMMVANPQRFLGS
jgi:phosphotriesterase-related protein